MFQYLIARTAKRRPTLMHRISSDGITTMCGCDTRFWSKIWFENPLEIVMCRRCGR